MLRYSSLELIDAPEAKSTINRLVHSFFDSWVRMSEKPSTVLPAEINVLMTINIFQVCALS